MIEREIDEDDCDELPEPEDDFTIAMTSPEHDHDYIKCDLIAEFRMKD